MSHIANAISELEQQKSAIDQALSVLRSLDGSRRTAATTRNSVPRKRWLSPEGIARISAAAKKRWAEHRAAQTNAPSEKPTAGKKAAPAKKTKKRVLSAEARKKMALAAKKRWAAQKRKSAA